MARTPDRQSGKLISEYHINASYLTYDVYPQQYALIKPVLIHKTNNFKIIQNHKHFVHLIYGKRKDHIKISQEKRYSFKKQNSRSNQLC